jgi:hypothetical protein
MRFRELVETPIDETERRGRQQSDFTAPDPKGAGPMTALRDAQECRDRRTCRCILRGSGALAMSR